MSPHPVHIMRTRHSDKVGPMTKMVIRHLRPLIRFLNVSEFSVYNVVNIDLFQKSSLSPSDKKSHFSSLKKSYFQVLERQIADMRMPLALHSFAINLLYGLGNLL
jgi:hypothetical protein